MSMRLGVHGLYSIRPTGVGFQRFLSYLGIMLNLLRNPMKILSVFLNSN